MENNNQKPSQTNNAPKEILTVEQRAKKKQKTQEEKNDGQIQDKNDPKKSLQKQPIKNSKNNDISNINIQNDQKKVQSKDKTGQKLQNPIQKNTTAKSNPENQNDQKQPNIKANNQQKQISQNQVLLKQPISFTQNLQNQKASQLYNERSQFQGIKKKQSKNQVCHFSFKIVKYPDELRFLSQNQKNLSENERELYWLYQLVYCVDCEVAVYWGCLSEKQLVQQVKIDEIQYLVFQCDLCKYKKDCENNKVKISENIEQCCVECKNSDGYLKKVLYNNFKNQDQKLEKSQANNQFGFVHPICAFSFPNIYQLGSPENMIMKHCSDVDYQTIYEENFGQNQFQNSSKTCDICKKSSSRMLQCCCKEGECDKNKNFAHAFCIMKMNQELIFQVDVKQDYDYEEKMEKRWSMQLHFTDTLNYQRSQFNKHSSYESNEASINHKFNQIDKGQLGNSLCNQNQLILNKYKLKCPERNRALSSVSQEILNLNTQSPFLRVFCNEQRIQMQQSVCHCQKSSEDQQNLTQCQSCKNWYHSQCWGDHVDIQKGGPTDHYVKEQKQIRQNDNFSKQIDKVFGSQFNMDQDYSNIAQFDRNLCTDSENDSNIQEYQEMVSEKESEKEDESMSEGQESEQESKSEKQSSSSVSSECEKSNSSSSSSTSKQESSSSNPLSIIQDQFLLCDKCLKFSKLARQGKCGEGEFANIILGNSTIDDYLTNKKDNWSTNTDLQVIVDYDFRTMQNYEFNLFEHMLLYRFWYKILEQAQKKILHVDLYKSLLEKEQVNMIHSQALDNAILKKLNQQDLIQEQFKNKRSELFLFKEVFGMSCQQKLNMENVKYNEGEKKKLLEFMKTRLSQYQIITEVTEVYYNKLLEGECQEKIAQIYLMKQCEASDVRSLLQEFKQLQSLDHTQSQSFRKLDHDFRIYLNWVTQIIKIIQASKLPYSETKIVQKLREFKAQERSAKELSNLQYEFLKELFLKKISISQAQNLILEGRQNFVQDKNELQNIKNCIDKAEQLSKEIYKAGSHQKPIKHIVQVISQLSQLWVKPNDIQDILKIFQQSKQLRINAKSFLCTKIHENIQWLFELFKSGKNPEEIIEECEQQDNENDCLSLRQRFRHYVFSIKQCEELYHYAINGQAPINQNYQIEENKQAKNNLIFLDQNLKKGIKTKYEKIEQIRGPNFKIIRGESSSIEQLNLFINQINQIDNVDLDYELEQAKLKLSILRLGQKLLQGGPVIQFNNSKNIQQQNLSGASNLILDQINNSSLSKNNSSGKKMSSLKSNSDIKNEQTQSGSKSNEQFIQEDIKNILKILQTQVKLKQSDNSQIRAEDEDLINVNKQKQLVQDLNENELVEKLTLLDDEEVQKLIEDHRISKNKNEIDGGNEKQYINTNDHSQLNQNIGGQYLEIDQSDLMNAIYISQNKDHDQLDFPKELCMMLKAKIQVAKDIKVEFQKIIENNMDSFNQQMFIDMKKCVQKAQKEHGIKMKKEKEIIENLKYSEEWFTKTYQKLKQIFGGAHALVNVDFKEFMEILECIQENSQMEEILNICSSQIQNSSSFQSGQIQGKTLQVVKNSDNSFISNIQKYQSEGQKNYQLVCAAKNLFQSLMKCKWMVEVQQLIGFGKFSQINNKMNQSLSNQANKNQENDQKSKDIKKIIELSEMIEELNLQNIVSSYAHCKNQEFQQILRQMKDLQEFSQEFQTLFTKQEKMKQYVSGKQVKNIEKKQITIGKQCFERASQLISNCQKINQRINEFKGVKPLDEIENKKISIIKTIESLDKLIQQMQNLYQKKKDLNISFHVQNPVNEFNLDQIFQLSLIQLQFAKEYNQQKLQNQPSYKLTIDKCKKLYEQFLDFESFKDNFKINQKELIKSCMQECYIVVKLQRNIRKYEKLRINYSEYIKYKKRLQSQIDENGDSEVVRVESDMRFNYDFVKNLISDSMKIDIDIFNEDSQIQSSVIDSLNDQFLIKQLLKDLEEYDEFKIKLENILSQLENQIFQQQTSQVIKDLQENGLIDQFNQMIIQITRLPIYDKQTHKKINTFVWIFNSYELLQSGVIPKNSPFYVEIVNRDQNLKNQSSNQKQSQYLSIKQYQDFIQIHRKYLNQYPELQNHSIVQQLYWEVQKAQNLIDEIKSIRFQVNQHSQIWVKGLEYYKNLDRNDDNEYQNRRSFGFNDNYNYQDDFRFQKQSIITGGYLGKDKGKQQTDEEKFSGIIGPKLSSERLISLFKKKTQINDLLERKMEAENIKINLQEEIKILNKWIQEYQELAKYKNQTIQNQIKEQLIQQLDNDVLDQKKNYEYQYQQLFEQHQFQQLKQIAKEVFISPVYNYQLFQTLKKRLEVAYEIGQDLKFILKEFDNSKKVNKSRIYPYIQHYLQNSNVKGIPQIQHAIEIFEKSKLDIKQIKIDLKNEVHLIQNSLQIKEIKIEEDQIIESDSIKYEVTFDSYMPQERFKQLEDLKNSYSSIKINFEEQESIIKKLFWIIEITKIYYVRNNQAQISQNQCIMQYDEYKEYSNIYSSFQNESQTNSKIEGFETFKFLIQFFNEIQKKVNEVINLINKDQSDDLQKIKDNLNQHYRTSDFNQSLIVCDLIDLQEFVNKKIQKNKDKNQFCGKKRSKISDSNEQESSDSSQSSSSSSLSDSSLSSSRQSQISSSNQSSIRSVSQAENNKRQKKQAEKEYQRTKVIEHERRVQAISQYNPENQNVQDLQIGKQGYQDSSIVYDDKVFSDIRVQFEHKIRSEQKQRITKCLNQLLQKYQIDDEYNQNEILESLEGKCFHISFSKVDEIYQQKINNICRNLVYMIDIQNTLGQILKKHMKDICLKMFIIKISGQHINPQKLIIPNAQFKDNLEEVANRLEKASLTKNKQKQQPSQQEKQPEIEINVDKNKINNEQFYLRSLEIKSKQSLKNQNIQQTIQNENINQNQKRYIESEDAISQNQNPAEFSSDDEQQINISANVSQNLAPKEYKAPIIKYNPAQAINSNKYNKQQLYQQNDQQDIPILYDPFTKQMYKHISNNFNQISVDQKYQEEDKAMDFKEQIKNNNKNIQYDEVLNDASPGSLLQIWKGNLDLSSYLKKKVFKKSEKDNSLKIEVEFYSKQDIKIYQDLPDWPVSTSNGDQSIILKGKANITEVIKHFSQLKKEGKQMIKGYVIQKTQELVQSKQQNSNIFFAHFNELRGQSMCSLVNLYDSYKHTRSSQSSIKEVNLYLMPICSQTIQFCQDMDIIPNIESEHIQKQPNIFAYFANISKHPVYSLSQKAFFTRSSKPSLNPVLIISGDDFNKIPHLQEDLNDSLYQQNSYNSGIIKQEQISQQYTSNIDQEMNYFPNIKIKIDEQEAKIDQILQDWKLGDISIDEIMLQLSILIKQKNSKKIEDKLLKIMQEISELSNKKQMQSQNQYMQDQNMMMISQRNFINPMDVNMLNMQQQIDHIGIKEEDLKMYQYNDSIQNNYGFNPILQIPESLLQHELQQQQLLLIQQNQNLSCNPFANNLMSQAVLPQLQQQEIFRQYEQMRASQEIFGRGMMNGIRQTDNEQLQRLMQMQQMNQLSPEQKIYLEQQIAILQQIQMVQQQSSFEQSHQNQ